MDEAELKDLIPPKEDNPLLKRKPLNLGTRFWRLNQPDEPLEVDSLLSQPHLTILFFGAQWVNKVQTQCNVTRSFIPSLQNFYNEANLQQKKVELIYIGFDKNKKESQTFTKEMPWLGLSFADERTAGLKQFYDIRSIPKLVLIDSKGEAVNCECRSDIYNKDVDASVEAWEQLKKQQDKKYYYEEGSV